MIRNTTNELTKTMPESNSITSEEPITGKLLNERWQVYARHALYHMDGTWYHYLKEFPGALFDPEGYVLFSTEGEFRNSPYLQLGEHVHVPNTIASIPSYIRVGSEVLEDEEAYTNRSGSIYPYQAPDELDIRTDTVTVFEWLRKKERDDLITEPEFQRRLVWKPIQKSQFIESILLGIPLPPIYVNQNPEGQYILVDGLQRTTTLHEFISEEAFSLFGLEVLQDLNGLTFSSLPPRLQRRIEDRQLLLYVIKPSVPVNIVYDIFHRINTGGTQLTRQEIRNCLFIGDSTRLLRYLAESLPFKQATDWGISPMRMKDQEGVLRCLAFTTLDFKEYYHNDMDAFLAEAMKRLNRCPDQEREVISREFLRVMQWIVDLFGTRAFRLSTRNTKGRVNIAIMESVYAFFDQVTDDFISSNRSAIVANYDRLLERSDYLEAIRSSTGDTRRVIARFTIAQEELGRVG